MILILIEFEGNDENMFIDLLYTLLNWLIQKKKSGQLEIELIKKLLDKIDEKP